MNQWISVKDRLPDVPGATPENCLPRSAPVLYVVKPKDGEPFVLMGSFGKRGFKKKGRAFMSGGGDWDIEFREPKFGTDSMYYSSRPGDVFVVTHWMYVPAPPQEDK